MRTLLAILCAFYSHHAAEAASSGPAKGIVSIPERYITALEPEANIDSVAVAPASGDRPALLFATAKETNVVKVFDASTGKQLAELGASGTAADQYLRPNGVSVIDDLLFVVERDNHRVSVRSIPDYKVLATFGADVLQKPYGLWVHALGNQKYRLYVTDAYEMPDESVPPPDQLGERVKTWTVSVANSDANGAKRLDVQYERAFGDKSGSGMLRVVESIFGDPAHGNLMIAEEDESAATGLVVKVYNLGGKFIGRMMGKGAFHAQAEGLALYSCKNGAGYWLATDQRRDRTVYHVFDRKTLKHVGAFTGQTTANTDGVWLAPRGVPGFERGAFFAVHDDQAVSAFDWATISKELGLKHCD